MERVVQNAQYFKLSNDCHFFRPINQSVNLINVSQFYVDMA